MCDYTTVVGEDNQIGYDKYKSRLGTTRMALVTNRLICGQAECCGNYKGKLKTTRVLWWLGGRLRTTRLAVCGLWNKLRPHIVL